MARKFASAAAPASNWISDVMGTPPRLYTIYKNEIVPKLMEEGKFSNIMEVPKIVKVTLNTGIGDGSKNTKGLDAAVEEFKQITGQKPVVTKAKTSIAGFKIREGMPVGVAVTLRRDRMYEFMDRLINLSLPRVRDFRGVSDRGFDGRGNYTLGLQEQIIFPEIEYEKVETVRGLSISIVTTATNDGDGKLLLKFLGMPFRERG